MIFPQLSPGDVSPTTGPGFIRFGNILVAYLSYDERMFLVMQF